MDRLLLASLVKPVYLAQKLIDALRTKVHSFLARGAEAFPKRHELGVQGQLAAQAFNVSTRLFVLQTVVEKESLTPALNHAAFHIQTAQLVLAGVECADIPTHCQSGGPNGRLNKPAYPTMIQARAKCRECRQQAGVELLALVLEPIDLRLIESQLRMAGFLAYDSGLGAGERVALKITTHENAEHINVRRPRCL